MNPTIILLLLPVLTGLLLLFVRRNERRQQFVQQRLTKLTAEDNSEPPPLSLIRNLRRAPVAIFQLPHKFTAMLNAAFEAAGNRIRLLHLLIVGFFSAIIVIVFTSRLLTVNPALAM